MQVDDKPNIGCRHFSHYEFRVEAPILGTDKTSVVATADSIGTLASVIQIWAKCSKPDDWPIKIRRIAVYVG